MIDLAILGGGPAGYVAAESAGAKGLSVVLFEKNALGGVCLNEGCIPTKTLLYSAKMYEHALGGEKYGVFADNVRFDFGKIMQRKTKVIRKLVAGVGSKMKAHKVTVIPHEAIIEGRAEDGFHLSSNGENYTARHLLICTGSQAVVPPIPGMDTAGALTNREILNLDKIPDSLVIIGGGVIGMEFASFFNSMGAKVTVVEMLPEILGGLDSEISAQLRQVYTKKGITFHLSCKVTKVQEHEVFFIHSDGKEESIETDKILVSVGRRPVTKGFGLETLGVEVERGGIKVNKYMQTNVPNVYAAGDVTGFSLLAHTASREGQVAVDHICNGTQQMRYNAIPGVVYTNPEVACVGLSEDAAKAQNISHKVLRLPMAYSGRFVAENEGAEGLCKIIVSAENQQILGVHMMGNPSGEMIYGACMAIETEMTAETVEEIVFPHPTVSEIIKETLFTL